VVQGWGASSGGFDQLVYHPSTQTNDAGSYVVTVSNGAGGANSQAAVLTVLVPPTITAQPHSLTVNQDDTVTFSVTAVGHATVGLSMGKKRNQYSRCHRQRLRHCPCANE